MRALSWDGFLNVRDLGGLPLRSGGETRYGRVARSEAPHFLSGRGWRELRDHGVRTLVDLRCPSEGSYDPCDGVERRAIPLFHIGEPEFERRVKGVRDSGEFYRVVVDYSRAAIARAAAAVADAPDGAVVVHCHAGRDRTGIVSAVMLSAAGVPEDAIADDYVATRDALQPRHDDELAAATTPEQREWLERLHQVRPGYILNALDEVGDAADYLLASGLRDDQLERLRTRLTA